MNEINEIKIPEGVESISVKQHKDKIVIEFTPKEAKFKAGDKVTLKSGYTSKSNLFYRSLFDEYIGKELIIDYIESGSGNARCNNGFWFAEDWLEFYTEELKNGDLAIFWGDNNLNPTIRLYHFKSYNGHTDNFGTTWGKAVKWDGTKEQFEKILRGEID